MYAEENKGLSRKPMNISHLAHINYSTIKDSLDKASVVRDDASYWQSDGKLPHYIDFNFDRKVKIKKVMLLVDWQQDETYSPSEISVSIGNDAHDLQEAFLKILHVIPEEQWIVMDLDVIVSAFNIRIHFNSNFGDGKDVRIVQVKLI